MSSSDGPQQDPTQHLGEGDTEPTRRITSYQDDSWQEDAWPQDPAQDPAWGRDRELDDAPVLGPEAEAEPRSRGREAMIGLAGALVGFVLAFVVVAIGTSDRPTDDAELTALQERVTALEAAVAERDTQLAERDAQLAEREAQIAELETRLAEAEAAAGEGADELESQRQALEERAAALEERARALDEREAALDQREGELEGAPPADPGTPGEDLLPGDGLPDLDGETAETVVERVIERLRELLPGAGQ